MYRTIPLSRFDGGLNLASQPDVVRPDQATDLLNVIFTDVGAIKQRDGYAKFTSSALTNFTDSLSAFYKSDGTRQILAGAGTRLEAVNTSGAVVASATGLTGGPYTFARFGAPNTEVAYAGNGSDTLRKWDGSAWTAPTATVNGVGALAMPKGAYLAVTPWDNRLITTGFKTTTGGPNGTISSPSHVIFSDAGSPESYTTASAAVQLRPGDGEAIQGIVVWREFVFVFKETAFWIFYTTGTQGDGTPDYVRRPVVTGIGAVSPRAICAARDGVYFLGRNGVYRTTGGAPELISQIIDPFFVGGTSDFFQSNAINPAQLNQAAMTFHRERIHLSVPTGAATTNDRMLVFDPRSGGGKQQWWTLYDIPASAMCSFRVSSAEELVFAYPTGTKDLGRHSSQYLDDAGTAIVSRWHSGWMDFQIPNQKTIREWKIWGKGKVKSGMGYDYATPQVATTLDFNIGLDLWADGTTVDTWGSGAGPDTWGSGISLRAKLVRTSVRGTVFSLAFDSTLGASWEVHRLTLHLRGTREPSVVTASGA